MASVVLSGDTSGSVTLAAPTISGTTTQTLVAVSGTLAPIVSGTAVASTSGTSIDFTSIPSWVKRITVMFNGVSTNGSSSVQIQIGSGSVATSGYLGTGTVFAASSTASTSSTAGFLTYFGGNEAASMTRGGAVIISLIGSNIWVAQGIVSSTNINNNSAIAGQITLAGTLDRVRITTVNGTDTFDAGTINILYE